MIDPAALQEHSNFVRAVARGLLYDESRLDDVLQQTWLAAIEKPPREERSLKSWLASVAVNFARKARREDSRRAQREEHAARPEAVADPVDVLARESTVRGVVDSVFALREPYRTAVILRYYDDLTPSEIAKRLGVPVETVRTRLKRAMAQLRQSLDRRNGGDRRAWCLALVPLAGLSKVSAASAAVAHVGTAAARSTRFGPRATASLALAPLVLLLGGFVLWLSLPHEPASRIVARESRPLGASLEPTTTSISTAGATVEAARPSVIATARRATPGGTLVVRLRWEEDGKPAEGVRARVVALAEAESDPTPAGHLLDHVTGPDGSFRAEHLAPDDYMLFFDRFDPKDMDRRATVRVDSVAEVDLDVPRGITLEGTVTDDSARPLGGAAIVLCSPFPTDCGARVAETGADGSFRVRSISRGGYFGARALGFAASPLRVLPPKTVREQKVRITLTGRGGAISGIALDGSGQPVAGAEVLATNGDDDGGEPRRPIAALTGDDGRFTLEGIADSEASLVIRARGFAPWIEHSRVRVGETSTVTAHLGPGATLVGTLRDADGEPVPDARVDVDPEGFRESGLALSGFTDSDGAFRIDHVFEGPIHASVDDDDSDDANRRTFFARIGGSLSAADGSFRIGHVFSDILVAPRGRHESRGTAEAKFVAHEVETLRWDALLVRGLELRGRLLDSDGEALVGWTVVATPPAQRDDTESSGRNVRSNGVSDATGRFSIPNCLDAAYRLELYEPDQWAHNACFGVAGVRAGAREVVIHVPPSARATAWITGTLLEADGRPAAEHLIAARPANGALMVNRRRTDTDGAFRIGPLPPGRYDVLLRLPDIGQTLRDGAELSSGETLDLGTVRLHPSGSLVAKLRRDDGRPLDRPDIWIYDARRATYWRPSLDGDVVRAAVIPAGRWIFSVAPSGDSDVACAEIPFEIRSGAETVIEVPLRSADVVTLHFAEPKGEEWTSFIRVEVRSETSGVVWKRCFGRFRDGELRATLRLPSGRYAVEAFSDDGAQAATTFAVPSSDPRKPIDVPLRRHAHSDSK